MSRVIWRVATFTLLWWVLTEGQSGGWALAAAAIAGATAVSLLLLPASGVSWSPVGWIRFVPFFVRQSLAGSLDVSRRALSPSLPLAPGFTQHRVSLVDPAGRLLLASIVSLLPGTVSVRLRGDRLDIHALDTGLPVDRTVNELERRVAALYRRPPSGRP